MSRIQKSLLLGAGASVLIGSQALAYEFSIGLLDFDLTLQADAQGAYFDDGVSSENTGSNFDWTARLNVEHIFESGWTVGARVEYDQAFDVESDEDARDHDVELDELYGYVSGVWGRVEVGLQDGPADTLSLHAPTLGIGQIRGGFARYVSGPASLSPYDTRDEFKVIYLSPPINGLRFGVSYGPEMEVDENNPDPTLRTIQSDHIEAAVQYQLPLEQGVALAFSGAYVHATSDPITMREDISSWSVGSELRWQNVRIGGAYVSRGDSNSFEGRDETEINIGARWRANDLSIAASAARIERSTLDRTLVGVGGSYDINEYVTVSADVVHFSDDYTAQPTEEGYAVLGQIRLRF